jgi:hypothetical protein
MDGGISNVLFIRQVTDVSKKYAEKTRKGRIVPHVKDVYLDMYNFRINQMIEERMNGIYFKDSYDEYAFYRDQGIEICHNWDQYPRTEYEELVLERDFINSLT